MLHRWSGLRLWLAVAMLASCVACANGTQGGTGTGATGGTLVWGKSAEVDLLDPAVAANSTSWEIFQLSYERLVGLDERLKVVPELAARWKQTSPTTYVFELRPGMRFSNGRDLTADDVAGSLRRLADPRTASFWAVQTGIRTAAASGPLEVTVTLLEPRTSFLAALAGSPAAILPMKELTAGTFDPKKEMLGTGPYKVVAHTQNESWTFERNPHYWRPGVPKADRLSVRIIPDAAAMTAALRTGDIDVTSFDTPDAIRLLQGQAGVQTVVQSTTDYYRLDVNARSSVFADDRLRAALSLAIDRNKLRDVALAGVGKATAAASVGFDHVCDPAVLPYAKPDPARARALVQAAGATGKTVEILAYEVMPMSSPIAQVIQQGLQEIGLKARIVSLDIGAIRQRAYNGKTANFDLVVAAFAGYADPAMVLTWWNPDLAGFSKPWAKPDPRLNALIGRSLGTPLGPARDRALRDTCGRIAANGNIIPLVSKDAIVAYRSDRIDVRIPQLEGYYLPLRKIAEFGVR